MAPLLDWPDDFANQFPVYEDLLAEAHNRRRGTPGEIAYDRALDEIAAISAL